MEFVSVPDDPMLHILSYLNFADLTRCGFTCHRLYSLSQFDCLWKRHCYSVWLNTLKCPDDLTWRENFAAWYRDFGKYWKVYKQIRRAWDQIESYTKKRCPGIYSSLQDGASEVELDEAEKKLGVKFPLDLRCAYRIHNGQKLPRFHQNPQNAHLPPPHGMFGTIKFSRYYCSELLLPLEGVTSLKRDGWSVPCINPIACVRYSIRVFISCSDQPLAADIPGTAVFYAFSSQTHNRLSLKPSENWDVFMCGNSFLDYFVSYANKLSNEDYPVVEGEILRFYHDDDAVATTDHVRISAATAFMPMMSSVDPTEFVFAYRITLSMDKDVHPRFACQLETRTWYITDDNGEFETVNGPGVVGEYPIVRPGSTFSYISCTHFCTTRGTMHGIYTMRNLATGETLDAEVPKFRMQCPPCATLRKQ